MMKLINSVADRFPVLTGFCGVTVAPDVVPNVVDNINLGLHILHDNATVIFQALIVALTIIVEILRAKNKQKKQL